MDVYTMVAAVESREDLIQLVEVLHQDLVNNPAAWENADLARYLEAMAAWLHDMEGYYQNRASNMPRHPTWQMVAEILVAARDYE